jgi:hypothetical protein
MPMLMPLRVIVALVLEMGALLTISWGGIRTKGEEGKMVEVFTPV